MSRLVDATICPDCRGVLDASATCTQCGLRVQGPLAVQLWGTMVAADRLVEQLRAAPVPGTDATSGLVPTPGMPPAPSLSDVPRFPTPLGVLRPRPRRLPAASVPVVLLSLGAVCLLVAAIVFVAVTWGALGLTGRTLVLLGFTSLLAVIAVLLTRKSLRGAAETFWLVVAGMLTVDLLAAESAGLAGLDALDWRAMGAAVGGMLLVLGVSVGSWARRQPVGRLLGMEVVAVTGAAVATVSNAWLAENPALGSTVAVPLLAGAFVLLRRRVPVAAYGIGGLAVVTWLVLLTIGFDRSVETAGFTEWWSDVRGWPLLAAALLAGLVAQAPRVPDVLRPVAAGLSLTPLVLLANAPQAVGTQTRDVLVECATVAVLAALAAVAPRTWARGAAVLTALGIVWLGVRLLVGPWVVLGDLSTDGGTPLGQTMTAMEHGAGAWTAGVVALVLVAALAALLTHVPEHLRGEAGLAVGALAPGALVLGGLVIVLHLEPPLWAGVLAAALATAVAASAAWWVREHVLAAVLASCATAYLALLTLVAASAADLLVALVTSALLVGLAAASALRERTDARPSAAVAGALAALAGGWALVAWGQVMAADTGAQTLTLAVYAGLVGVIAAPLTRHASTRITLEATAAVLAVTAVASTPDDATTAMALTIVGTALCLIAVTVRDRAPLGWAGAVVLGFATVIRVEEGITAPELYTLPAAALLIAAGAWRLGRDRTSSSFSALGSGLTLALLPSLLLALDEPVSLRGALIGAAGVLVLIVGVQQRLTAPFVLGALTTGVLAVRHLQPIADAVPRWISLGVVGLLLLVIGITWESRLRNVASARRYLTALR